MYALIYPEKILILGAEALPKDCWEPLLKELKAKHVPIMTPAGKRFALVQHEGVRTDAIIYRTQPMSDDEIILILDKYEIPACTDSQGN